MSIAPSGRTVVVIEQGDPHEASDLEIAKQIGDVLQKEYPGHPWIIGFQGGGLVIRHIAIADEVHLAIGRQGFSSLLPREKLGTPKEIRKSAVEFAGQLLEAFQLPRGSWDGRRPVVPNWKNRKDKDFQ